MRTTLVIVDDVLAAAKAIARQKNRTVGQVVSELARAALRPVSGSARNGIPLLPVRKPGVTVTPDMVTALRDEEPC